MTEQRIPERPLRKEYAQIAQVDLLRPIRTEEDLKKAESEIDRLSGQSNLSQEEEDYLEALSLFVERYETLVSPLLTPNVTGLSALKHLLDENNLSALDLGRLLGEVYLGSSILRGEQPLREEHAQLLASYFRVSASLFLQETPTLSLPKKAS